MRMFDFGRGVVYAAGQFPGVLCLCDTSGDVCSSHASQPFAGHPPPVYIMPAFCRATCSYVISDDGDDDNDDVEALKAVIASWPTLNLQIVLKHCSISVHLPQIGGFPPLNHSLPRRDVRKVGLNLGRDATSIISTISC